MKTLQLTHEEIETITEALDSQFWNCDKQSKEGAAYLPERIRDAIYKHGKISRDLSTKIKEGSADV